MTLATTRFSDDGMAGSAEDPKQHVVLAQRYAVLAFELKAAQCAVKAAEYANQWWSSEPPHRPGCRVVAADVDLWIQEGTMDVSIPLWDVVNRFVVHEIFHINVIRLFFLI
jgi:hypothetical protein